MIRNKQTMLALLLLLNFMFTTRAQNVSQNQTNKNDYNPYLEVNDNDFTRWCLRVIWDSISVPFMALTVAAYAIAPDRKTLHGRCLVAYSTSLLIFFIALVIGTLTSNDRLFNAVICMISNTVLFFTCFSSFLWLQVMAYDIWYTFRKNSTSPQRKFVIYFTYVLTISLILLAGLIVHTKVTDSRNNEECFLRGIALGMILLLSSPIFITNLFFFVATAIQIRKVKTQNNLTLNNADSRRHNSNEEARFRIYFKLFLVIGGSWMLTSVMILITTYVYDPNNLFVFYLSFVLDMIIGLQGFFIFIVCVWTTQLFRLLIKRILSAKLLCKKESSPSELISSIDEGIHSTSVL